MDRPTIKECCEQGMTANEAAAATGLTYSAVYKRAKRKKLSFALERVPYTNRNPVVSPLALLTKRERTDYNTLKRAGYTKPEALIAVGRADLVATSPSEGKNHGGENQ